MGVKRRDLWPLGVCWCVPHRLLAAGARIGLLSAGTPQGTEVVLSGLRTGLREHGHVEGSNVAIEARFAHGQFERLPELARELVSSRVDVLVTLVTQASIAAKESTKTIPIVMVGVSDPEAAGLVTNLSRPGGNVTGTCFADRSRRAVAWLSVAAVPELAINMKTARQMGLSIPRALLLRADRTIE